MICCLLWKKSRTIRRRRVTSLSGTLHLPLGICCLVVSLMPAPRQRSCASTDGSRRSRSVWDSRCGRMFGSLAALIHWPPLFRCSTEATLPVHRSQKHKPFGMWRRQRCSATPLGSGTVSLGQTVGRVRGCPDKAVLRLLSTCCLRCFAVHTKVGSAVPSRGWDVSVVWTWITKKPAGWYGGKSGQRLPGHHWVGTARGFRTRMGSVAAGPS